MTARVDLNGARFGRWLVLSYAGDRLWLCRCDCGTERSVSSWALRSGSTLGCRACRTYGPITHGCSGSRLHRIWVGVLNRCLNPNEPTWPRYGGRGISVCDRWRNSFEEFKQWADANGYADHLTIERIDNDLGYSPENCRWATRAEQARNRSSNKRVEWQGKQLTVAEISEQCGLRYATVSRRIKLGWPISAVLNTPLRRRPLTQPER